MGKACPLADATGQKYYCVDDPRDSCDPKRGWVDCIGVCVTRDYL